MPGGVGGMGKAKSGQTCDSAILVPERDEKDDRGQTCDIANLSEINEDRRVRPSGFFARNRSTQQLTAECLADS